MGEIINGKEVALKVKEEIKSFTEGKKQEGKRMPKIASILVGDDGGSIYYMNNQEKVSTSLGVDFKKVVLDKNITEEELINTIDNLNNDNEVDGIILQLPLPKGLNEKNVIKKISPSKDIDCLTFESQGKLYMGEPEFLPCTPNSVVTLLKSLNINLEGKKVLVRCDFNVPLDENFNITDNRRIVGALPTIKYLLEKNCKVILCSHLGRPKGEVKKEFSLAPVAKELSRLLGKEVKLANDIIGESAKELTSNMNNGDIVLLENVRFDAREEANDKEFAKELASMAEIYVNDAFGTAHRAHSSTAGVAEFLPAVAGFLMEKEINFLGTALENPKRPFVAILGGKKVSDKIGVIDNLLEKVDALLIGGGMAYTFFKAMGYNIGNSICEEDKLELASSLIEKAKNKGVKLMLPIDNKIGKEVKEDTESKNVKVTEIPDGWQGLDIGEETIKMYEEELKDAKTVVWNGPLGLFEFDQFAEGTNSIARFLGKLENATTIIGGGDSAAAIEKLGIADEFTHISTGGGASLEFLEGKKLPGVECLLDK